MKFFQIIVNIVLYGYLFWYLYKTTCVEWDPWDAFVVAFIIVVAIITSLMPSLHAPRTSPGQYPYDD